MHEVLVNRLGGLSLPRKSVVRLTDRPDMTLDVYRGRKTTMQQKQQQLYYGHFHIKLEVQKMQFLGLISSQNKTYCSILHLHSKHMVVFYKR